MTTPVPAANGPDAFLVGRAHDLAQLTAMLPQAGAGSARLVRGEPGVGKTALLEAIAAQAERSGTRVLRVTGAESEAQLAFAGLHQLLLPLQPLAEHLAAAHRKVLDLAFGTAGSGTPDQFVLSTACIALLQLAAQPQPVLVVIDDVHWLDRPSAEIVGFAVRRLHTLPVSMLLAARSGIPCAIDQQHIAEHNLMPLSTAASLELLQDRFPELAQPVRQQICTEASGNPLALLELPSALGDPRAAAIWSFETRLPLTRRLQSVFAARAETLPEETQWELLLAALEPRYVLTAKSERLHPAEAAGLIQQAPEGAVFRHPMVRTALVSAAAPERIRAAHAALAQYLPDDLDRNAWHRAGAAVEPDENVATDLEEAGRRAWLRGGASAAVSAMARAAELSLRPEERARRLTQAAYAAGQTGMAQYAEQLLAQARQAHASPADAAGTARAAQAYMLLQHSGDLEGSMRLLKSALADSPDSVSPDASGFNETLSLLLYNCQYASRPETWADFDAAYAALATPPSERTQLSIDIAVRPSQSASTVRQRLVQIFSALPEDQAPRTIVALCAPAAVVGVIPLIRDRLFRLLETERREGVVSTRMGLLTILALEDIQAANWQRAEEFSNEGRSLAQANGFQLQYWLFTCQLAKVAAHRGRREQAVRLALEAERWAAPRRIGVIRTVSSWIRAVAALGDQDAEDAFSLLSRTSPANPLPERSRFVYESTMDWIEAAVRCGRHFEARAHLDAAHAAGLPQISPYLAFLVAGSAALCASDTEADTRYTAALSMDAADLYPFEQGRLLLSYGQRLRRARRREDAVERLNLAWEIFDRIGAQRWTQTAAAELRAAGHTVRSNLSTGTDDLTAQELLIAQLAARGLTNRQIGTQLSLSPRTISTHLYNVFPKLGVTSRAGLGEALRSAGHADGTPE
ncbi:AAA family ATPase [Streptomyces sp. NPDC003832]